MMKPSAGWTAYGTSEVRKVMKHNERNIPFLTRRELLRVGGISLVGGYLNAFRPFNVRAEEKVKLHQPRRRHEPD
jgi:hypothetical protein